MLLKNSRNHFSMNHLSILYWILLKCFIWTFVFKTFHLFVFFFFLVEAVVKPKQTKSESENVANAVTTFLEMIKARPDQMITIVTTGLFI